MEDLESDWTVLRRGTQDRVPKTMNTAEAIERLTLAIHRFFNSIESYPEKMPNFSIAIEHAIQDRTHERLTYRVVILGIRHTEVAQLFAEINKGPFHDSVEEALEEAFHLVVQILENHNEAYETDIIEAEEALNLKKAELLKLKRNVTEMGFYDCVQVPLPFTKPYDNGHHMGTNVLSMD